MKAGNPIEALAASVHHACLIGLKPIEYPEYEFKRTPGKPGAEKVPTGRVKHSRPRPDLVSVVMFEQTWGSTALGFGGIGGQAITGAYTVIVEGPTGDACVYFSGQMAYHIERPNAAFNIDVSTHSMKAVAGAKARYELPPEQAGA